MLHKTLFQAKFLLFSGILLGLFACTFTKKIKNGATAIDRKQYRIAIDFLEEEFEIARSKEERAEKAYLLGTCYTKVNEIDNATQWYDEAVSLDYGPKAYWALANSFKQKESYKKAIGLYRLAGEEGYPSDDVNREMRICKQAMTWDGEEVEDLYAINPLDANSLYSDYAPTFYEGGYIVFTSDRVVDPSQASYNWTGRAFSDLYIVQKNGGEPLLFDNFLNTVHNEANATFNKTFDQIYFTRCFDNDGDDYCKIMWSEKINGRWAEAEEAIPMEPGYNYMHPALIENDSVMILSCNLTGGEGGYDLFYSLLEDEGWSSPEPMPSRLNTMGNESFPTVNGDTLFYSSDYLPGLGGMDIFMTRVNKRGEWSNPVNMKKPINSGADDFGLIIDKDANTQGRYDFKAYFTSSRMNEDGDNIFQLTKFFPIESEEETPEEEVAEEEKKDIKIYLAGKVVANDYADPDNPNSEIVGKSAVRLLDVDVSSILEDKDLKTDENGRFFMDLSDNTTYDIAVKKEGFFNKVMQLELEGIAEKANEDTTINVEILLDKIFVGKEIVLENIYYDYDKATIRQDAIPALQELATMLKDNPSINVELSAHTDCRGTAFYNINLSQSRALSVTTFLIDAGIDRERLIAKGYGKSKPALECNCDDCTEEEHQVNRRTAFKILE